MYVVVHSCGIAFLFLSLFPSGGFGSAYLVEDKRDQQEYTLSLFKRDLAFCGIAHDVMSQIRSQSDSLQRQR